MNNARYTFKYSHNPTNSNIWCLIRQESVWLYKVVRILEVRLALLLVQWYPHASYLQWQRHINTCLSNLYNRTALLSCKRHLQETKLIQGYKQQLDLKLQENMQITAISLLNDFEANPGLQSEVHGWEQDCNVQAEHLSLVRFHGHCPTILVWPQPHKWSHPPPHADLAWLPAMIHCAKQCMSYKNHRLFSKACP